ncbi:UDP-N-acetylmuramate dehydrogenase [Thermodesulforhabdus norvegica]|uniref:UDP-N-acetylenolpyruvoylglucosamine reductase n=1 Tax=Thermodesulforhabdus norvegica TaxID=39841 RepID=A0A1I4RFZ9_9BACT|nr:UDP-N-acetylmuramate dehydrogenase [Thermodesulforhabdus norvegica]SFM51192.1 UDP-N-acetylmuramate dehydrogenase [Thermodesulforhabdus norvegica]
MIEPALKEFIQMVEKDRLQRVRCLQREPLSRHTTFRIGGPVDLFVEVFYPDDVAKIMSFCKTNGLPIKIMGGGSNLLVSDGGVRGLVVKLEAAKVDDFFRETANDGLAYRDDGNVIVRVHGGLKTKTLISWCVRMGFSGCEFLAGIPATVGGAVKMNAGTQRGCMGDVVETVEVIDSEGKYHVLDYMKDCRPSYRHADIPESGVVVSATFRLLRSRPDKVRLKVKSIMKERLEKQPLGYPSAGCVFRNPAQNLSAGYLIDKCALKGVRIGDAEISAKHANWIINRGRATAKEVLSLIEMVKKRVFDEFGLVLQEELEIWHEDETM